MTTDWNKHHCLGELSVETFLEDYWQQKPLLVRNAFPDLVSPVSAEELAGLACEDGVNARLVLEKGKDRNWQAEFAPIPEERFGELPETGWSLLVSDIERHVPEAAFLLKPFRFIPDWRIDDLMVSYAPPGGSVGPHTDEYDVFLIQLSGQRLWKISEDYKPDTLCGTDLCILEGFDAQHEWLLSPGDMLYLPPRVAHHGIAQDAGGEHCLTASVGFRAPSLKAMTADYVNYLNEHVHGSQRYRDSQPQAAAHHAQISDATVEHFIDYLRQGLSTQPEQVREWLGRFSSDNSNFEEQRPENPPLALDALLAQIKQHGLAQSPWSNFLFADTEDGAILFVDGESYKTNKAFARMLCDDRQIDSHALLQFLEQEKDTDKDAQCLLAIFTTGSLILGNAEA
ncbi:MAG TPA: cupin domain-containing protein [Gammaproteobacteria bacterium]|nr:cupin domain-containing protein [Gammaproteobacteria bacterium]